MKLSNYQKKILELLLDKYERNGGDLESVHSNRAIMIKPVDVYKEYDSDYADIDVERDFERDVLELKDQGLIDLRSKDRSIYKIVLIVDSAKLVYEILGREQHKDIIKKQLDLYNKWLGYNTLIDKYCHHQIDLLQAGKKAKYELGVADNLLKLLAFINSNTKMVLERELSIAVFGDTKIFENEYKSKLIYVLKTYGEFDEIIADAADDKEAIQIIFEELNIFANPKYVYFKGNAEIVFEDNVIYKITKDIPMALPMDIFTRIKSFNINDSQIMTVENLASYNRIKPEDCFCIFLAGYHNSAKQAMIKLIYEQNCEKIWMHFGDIDPDGFMIFENLKNKTGIEFRTMHMSVEELQIYEKYTKTLNAQDIKKAQTLISRGVFIEEMQYMIKNNVKLEQEVVSWMES